MPSWEEVVSWVSIASSSRRIRDAAQRWQAVFSHLETVQSNVAKLQQDVEGAPWAGRTADALVEHLDKITKTAREVIEAHRRIAVGLQDAATHLDEAVSKIPVPSWVKDEAATQRKPSFEASGQLSEYRPNEFHDRMPWITLNGLDPTGGEAELGANLGQRFWHWYHEYRSTADSARTSLMNSYAIDARRIGAGRRVASPQVGGASRTKPGTGAGVGSKEIAGGALSSGVSAPSMPMSAMTPSLGGGPLGPGLGSGGLPPDLASAGLSSPDLGSAKLADAAGLGGGGGLAGLGPIGAGGAGAMSGPGLGLGPAVSPQDMVGETPADAAAGRLSAGGTAGLGGTGGSVMGMMPGGHEAGMASDGVGETDTRLVEDDKNIFGPRLTDRDLPGDVIG